MCTNLHEKCFYAEELAKFVKDYFLPSLFSLLVLVCFLFVPRSYAESGVLGDDIKWEFNERGILTITGTGNIPNYESSEKTPWYSIRNKILYIKINYGIQGIGSNAFSACEKLVCIEIPRSVNSIGSFLYNPNRS